MIIRTYRDALLIARAAGADAANRRMRNARRKQWNAADYDHAVSVMQRLIAQWGYDFEASALAEAA